MDAMLSSACALLLGELGLLLLVRSVSGPAAAPAVWGRRLEAPALCRICSRRDLNGGTLGLLRTPPGLERCMLRQASVLGLPGNPWLDAGRAAEILHNECLSAKAGVKLDVCVNPRRTSTSQQHNNKQHSSTATLVSGTVATSNGRHTHRHTTHLKSSPWSVCCRM